MNYYQFKLTRPEIQDESDLLIAQLADIGFESFEEEETTLIAYIPEKDYADTINDEVAQLLKNENADAMEVAFIADRNWNEVWESNYPSVTISDACVVRAPFHEAPENIAYDIVIKPKMAFGTAHHETTAQVLKLLLAMDVAGKRVLDMGCGSGVLAILCSMKGAENVVAIDYDEWSYSNTIENAEVNNVTNIGVILGDADSLVTSMAFDLILANINKNILIRDMYRYAQVLVAGGEIVFSGFYSEDIPDIVACAQKNGMSFLKSSTENNWAVTHFIKE